MAIEEKKKKILIVDDEPDILQSIDFTLKQNGFETYCCINGTMALSLYQKHQPDLILLDLMLPDINGFDICRRIRETDQKTLILMLTAKTGELDTVEGLTIGANDYISKPVRLKELTARIKSHLRHEELLGETKKEENISKEMILGDLYIDLSSYSVKINNKDIDLTQREFELLAKLASSPSRVFSREQLLEEVWGWSFVGESRTIDVHIRYLREKIEKDPANPELIKTVRGIGYKLVA